MRPRAPLRSAPVLEYERSEQQTGGVVGEERAERVREERHTEHVRSGAQLCCSCAAIWLARGAADAATSGRTCSEKPGEHGLHEALALQVLAQQHHPEEQRQRRQVRALT